MRFAILLLAFSLAGFVQAQTPLQDMVKTEQAFSKMAEEKTAREAFMAFIADDGLLFRPGAVNGKKWMIEHPVPPSDKNPLLAWQPNFAGMSASGDMGFTTGPWESKPDRSNPHPSAYGHFVTVWKKQADGSWKWVVDLGISHPKSGGLQTLWHPTDKTTYTKPANVDVASATKDLLERDRIMSEASLNEGLSKAFIANASPEVRLYRAGQLPYQGRDGSVLVLARIQAQFKSIPIGGDVALAGDLGYTHGAYELADANQKVIERGSYVRIWKKQDGRWQIVLDVTNVH